MYNSFTALENLYDRYNAQLFGIALQVSPDKESAEEILILAFQKVYGLELSPLDHASIFTTMTRMIIQIAQEKFIPMQAKGDMKLKMFEKNHLLCHLLNGSFCIESYCLENKLSRAEFAKEVRREFMAIKGSRKITSTVRIIAQPGNNGRGQLTVVT